MFNARLVVLGASALGIGLCDAASAQNRPGWSTQVDGLTVYQSDTDLDAGGSFSSTRTFVRGTSVYRFDNGNSVGVSASFGEAGPDPAVTASLSGIATAFETTLIGLVASFVFQFVLAGIARAESARLVDHLVDHASG